MKDIAVFGAGGFGREVANLIRKINEASDMPVWNFIGFFDDTPSKQNTQNDYGKVLGDIHTLNEWNDEISIAIGIGSPYALKLVSSRISNPNVDFPNLIDPTVLIADNNNYSMGKGNIFTSRCTISIAVKIGDFNIFNNGTVLGHDDIIGNYNSFMPNVNISGGVTIGDCNFFGVKSTVLQYLKVGNNVKVGANSLMMRNSKDGVLYLGVPAKKMDL